MVWARLDDAILDNPKIVRAGPIGFALHAAAITWCSRNLTDGFVPVAKAKQLLATCWDVDSADGKSVRWTLSAVSGFAGIDSDELIDQVIQLLIDVDLWVNDVDERGNFGYRLHDYGKYNPTRAEVLAEREQRRTAGAAGGKAKAARRLANDVAPANQSLESEASKPLAGAYQTPSKTVAKLCPVPVPVPVPEEREAEAAAPAGIEDRVMAELGRHVEFAAVASRPLAKAIVEKFKTMQVASGTKEAWLMTSLEECAEDCTNLGLNREALTKKLMGYVKHSKAPRETMFAKDSRQAQEREHHDGPLRVPRPPKEAAGPPASVERMLAASEMIAKIGKGAA